MPEQKQVGETPWLPWPLSRSRWWTTPIPAERLAALRIGFGIAILVDIFTNYWSRLDDFFGRGSLGSPEVFAGGQWSVRWTAWAWFDDPATLRWCMVSWAIAAILLVAGIATRLAALWCWICSVSFFGLNYYLHNSGDNVRTITAFILTLAPCGAVWSLGGHARSPGERIVISPWSIRLLTVQLATIYFVNGFYKLGGLEWRDGTIMHWVMGDLGWTRMSYAWLPLPDWATYGETWITLVWELLFPLLIMMPSTRTMTLCLGVVFHLGTASLLQLAAFPNYMLCLYLPFLPWERFPAYASSWRQSGHESPSSPR